MEYSLNFCANKDFASKCALRAQCGCIYHANCTRLGKSQNYLDKNQLNKTFDFNFTMNSTYVKQENQTKSIQKNKSLSCSINYRVAITDEIKGILYLSFSIRR